MPEDNNTQPTNGPGDNNLATPVQPLANTSGQKVIQPSPELVQELQAQQQQPVQPTIVSSEPSQSSQPTLPQSVYPQPSAPSNGQMQVGVSASQLGLNTSHSSSFEWGVLIKKAVIIGVILVIVGVGLLFIKSSLTGLSTKILTNGSYTYAFKFKKSANEVQLSDGSTAYKYLNSEIAGVKPTNDPTLTSCSQIGSQWTQAFTVQVAGSQHPVCTPNNQAYSLFFTAQNHNQIFTVSFSSKQTSSVYPELQTIFSSVSISK